MTHTQLSKKTLVIVTGPTAGGKSALAIDLAERLQASIISADSRQMYRGIEIATAAPTAADMSRVPHYLVGNLSLDDYYSAACFERDASRILDHLWADNDYAIVAGGSMMYIDALTDGIDQLPTVSAPTRARILDLYESGGLEAITETLRSLDPDYLERVDRSNHRRIIHAIEISIEAGQPYSTLIGKPKPPRPYRIVRMAIDHPRQTLFDRINNRVDTMIAAGLEQEARRVYPRRELNSLNTVGLKEMFAMFDGIMDRPTAIARMAKNTRVYAKKQLTWMRRYSDITMLDPTRGNLTVQALDTIAAKKP